MRITIMTVALLVAATMAPQAAEANVYIQCPVKQVDSRVTTSLPEEWRATPQRGQLVSTEISVQNNATVLVCKYKAFDGTMSITRNAPAGMGCEMTDSGFKCSEARAQQQGKQNQTLEYTDVIVDRITEQNSGGDSGTKSPSVKTRGSCPDPMINGVEVRYLSRDKSGQYSFRLVAVVENSGIEDFRSGRGQQVVELHTQAPGGSNRQLDSWDFDTIPRSGGEFEASYDVLRWRLSDEFPPSYEFLIVYGPDVSSDGNKQNDDCTTRNNRARISGQEINDIIKASGI